MKEVLITKLDNYGRGICYINDKITFVKNALPEEIVNIKITKESKKYNEAIVTEYIKKSDSRIDNICPYFNECGGCSLLSLPYEDTINFKKDKLTSIMSKYANLSLDIDIVPCDTPLNYRNKITLKIVDGKVGYYESSTHNLVEINNCLLAEQSIQDFIKDVNKLNINNGEIIIRSNYNNELLIIINSEDDISNIDYLKENHKIVGIVLNDKTIIGENHFIEIINNKYFKVSYDSFFQINRNICSKLFNIIREEINSSDVLLDLYCGVGTLGINVSDKCNKVYGIEIIPNAVLNAIKNAGINEVNNANYLLGNANKCLSKIKDKIDIAIIDPPRFGMDKTTINTIKEFQPNKIIYVSCDPITLARDIKDLNELYKVKSIKGLDMFPYTYHCETICVLERK